MNRKDLSLTLKDVGEFELLNKHILPLLKDSDNIIGDDCAFLSMPKDGWNLIVTTDAGPRPLFYDDKHPYYFIWGWYTVLANISDLASTGCYPLAISLAVEAMPEMLVKDLRDYFIGVRTAAKKFGIRVSGGNIKANTQFISNATAFGYLKKGQRAITRRGCKPGDIVISIGDNGKYIVSYLKYLQGGISKLDVSERRKIAGPFPQIKEMQILNRGMEITAASDNSDGILGSLWNIAEKSNCGFEISYDNISLPSYIVEFAEKEKLDPWNIFFFWGDWQVIITLNPKEIKKFEQLCVKNKIKYTLLGTAITGKPKLISFDKGERRKLNLLRNENFTQRSYNSGIKNHLDYLLKSSLY